MEPIIRHVRDIKSDERRVLERVLGQPLKENQQVIIQVVTSAGQPAEEAAASSTGKLPEWCNVYDGRTEEQIAAVEEVILQRSDLTRP
jgi:hypothetical protein